MNGCLYDLALRPFARRIDTLREELLSRSRGRVLELGVGTGLNLRFYPPGVEVTGIEPDAAMLRRAKPRAAARAVQLLEGDAQALPFADASFDTVVGTLVLCTVPDPALAMREARRVLKPQGRLLLLEHVRRNTPLAGRVLDALTPLWKHVAGGCHLNRDPSQHFAEAGFLPRDEILVWGGYGRLWELEPSAQSASSS